MRARRTLGSGIPGPWERWRRWRRSRLPGRHRARWRPHDGPSGPAWTPRGRSSPSRGRCPPAAHRSAGGVVRPASRSQPRRLCRRRWGSDGKACWPVHVCTTVHTAVRAPVRGWCKEARFHARNVRSRAVRAGSSSERGKPMSVAGARVSGPTGGGRPGPACGAKPRGRAGRPVNGEEVAARGDTGTTARRGRWRVCASGGSPRLLLARERRG